MSKLLYNKELEVQGYCAQVKQYHRDIRNLNSQSTRGCMCIQALAMLEHWSVSGSARIVKCYPRHLLYRVPAGIGFLESTSLSLTIYDLTGS